MTRKSFLHISLLFFASGFILLFSIYPKKAKVENWQIPLEASLEYPSVWNYRQSINSCGPYSAAAVIRITTKQNIDSEDLAKTTPWRFRGYTLPFGVISGLKKYHVPTQEFIVGLSDSDKLHWLKSNIGKGSPVILLIRKDGLLHYVTLLGYKENTFDMYDSLEDKGEDSLTVDTNSDGAGNSTWTNEQLLSAWNQGGLFGLYKNYAIITE